MSQTASIDAPGAERARHAFTTRFGQEPEWIVRAPGRVNLIGEHTDYNEGFVLPMAIDRAVWIAVRPRPDSLVRVHSLDFREDMQFDLGALVRSGPGWGAYLEGVAWALRAAGHALRGWEGVIAGDVPLAAGLSSSAAVELAAARAFAAVSPLTWDPPAMARQAQRAENEWVGVACGIMDQLTSACGIAGHALQIDCRTLAIEPVPLPLQLVVLVLDTGTRRGLVTSDYNQRRHECRQGAAAFGLESLRDLTAEAFSGGEAALGDPIRRRVRHVLSENRRTLEAAQALREGDLERAGRLMLESHASLRDDFEVSSPALDAMVEAARSQEGCWGARMTGAGFGGCAVALVDGQRALPIADRIAAGYLRATGWTAAVHVCRASDGASAHPIGRGFLS